MKNFICLSVCILIVMHAGYTQNIEVKWGPLQKIPKRTILSHLLSVDNNEIYTFGVHYSVNWEEGYPWLNKYNSDLGLVFSNQIVITTYSNSMFNLPSRPITAAIDEFYLMDDKFLLFSSIFALNNRTDYFLGQHVSREGIPTQEIIILEQGYGLNMNFPYRRKRGYVLSPDSSKFFVYANTPYKKGNNPHKVDDKFEIFMFKVFDNSFNILWESSITMPYNEGDILYIKQFFVDNDGTVFLLFNYSHNDDNKYIILSYNGNTDENKEIVFRQPNNRYIEDIKLGIDENNNIICAGFHSVKKVPNTFGSFLIVVDGTTHEIKSYTVNDFEKDFLLGFLNKKDLKDQLWTSDYDIQELVFLDNGSIVIIAEDEGSVLESRYFFQYEHLLIVKFNPDGSTKWVTHIPKKQLMKKDGEYLSYTASYFDDHIYILFNDLEKNISTYKAQDIENMTNLNNALITLVTIKPDGSYKKRPLLNTQGVGTLILPKLSFKASNNETLIYTEEGDTYKIGMVTYQ